jgi:hypothetical protein
VDGHAGEVDVVFARRRKESQCLDLILQLHCALREREMNTGKRQIDLSVCLCVVLMFDGRGAARLGLAFEAYIKNRIV